MGKRIYMSIAFPSIDEDQAQDIAEYLVKNTPGTSFTVHYDEEIVAEDDEANDNSTDPRLT